jgi:hypothetical protein
MLTWTMDKNSLASLLFAKSFKPHMFQHNNSMDISIKTHLLRLQAKQLLCCYHNSAALQVLKVWWHRLSKDGCNGSRVLITEWRVKNLPKDELILLVYRQFLE